MNGFAPIPCGSTSDCRPRSNRLDYGAINTNAPPCLCGCDLPEARVALDGVHSSIVVHPYVNHVETRSTGVTGIIDSPVEEVDGNGWVDVVPCGQSIDDGLAL